MDKLEAMRGFVQVVEAGSFTRAAEAQGVPGSTITRQIQALEAGLGIRLLHRTSRKISLTPQGDYYYRGCLDLLAQAELLDSGLQTQHSQLRGQLTIELPVALAYCLIMPRITEFTARYPDIQVIINTANRTADLAGERIDCVIRIGSLHNDSLIARSLGTLPMVICASPGYLQQYGTPQHPQDLARRHQLIQVRSAQTRRMFEHTLHRDSESLNVRGQWQIAVNDAQAALIAAKAGAGVVTTYQFLVAEAVSCQQLVRLFPDWQIDPLPVHIAWPENKSMPLRVRVFIDWVTELFTREPPAT